MRPITSLCSALVLFTTFACGGRSASDSPAAAGSTGDTGPVAAPGGADSGGDTNVSGGGMSVGGAANQGGTPAGDAGAETHAGGADVGGGAAGVSGVGGGVTCAPGQWDCSAAHLGCSFYATADMPKGCVCDLSRPRTADDCAPNETIVCMKTAGSVSHVQCSCEPINKVYTSHPPALAVPGDTFSDCPDVCRPFFGPFDSSYCFKSFSSTTCSPEGVCMDTQLSAADLREQGLDCGCEKFEGVGP